MLRSLDYNQIQLLQIKAAVKLLGNIQVSVSFTLSLGRGLLLSTEVQFNIVYVDHRNLEWSSLQKILALFLQIK